MTNEIDGTDGLMVDDIDDAMNETMGLDLCA